MKTKGLESSKKGRMQFLRSRNNAAPRRCHGFKLIELAVVLAIASTLGFTAVSASSGSSSKATQGARATAQSALADIAVLEEQYFLNHKRYTGDLGIKGLGVASATTPGEHYSIRVELPEDLCPAGFCYIVSAVPQGRQADDECGTLSLTSDGSKLPAGCW